MSKFAFAERFKPLRNTRDYTQSYELLVTESLDNIEFIQKRGYYLNASKLQDLFVKYSLPLGAVSARKGSRLSQRAAWRIARRCASLMENISEDDRHAIAQSWFFPIWTELCTLIPIRHLCRQLIREYPGQTVFIQLPSTAFTILNFWEQNEIELIYVGANLKKCGAKVVFILTTGPNTSSEDLAKDTITLSFTPNKNHFVPYDSIENSSPSEKDNVLVPAGIRYYKAIIDELPNIAIARADYAYSPGPYDISIIGHSAHLKRLQLPFQLESRFRSLQGFRLYRSCKLDDDLCQIFAGLMGSLTISALENATEAVRSRHIRWAHICDHSFFEASLIAHATRRRGGNVTLWPHSSNAIHVNIYSPNEIKEINCATRTAKAEWTKALPGVPCRIRSDLTLQRLNGVAKSDPGEPVHVLLIGGAHALRRTPLVDIRKHIQSYRAAVQRILDIGPKCRLLYRQKVGWEDDEWFRNNVSISDAIEFVKDAPTHIKRPNLVFLTISLGSTAIIEGISRGIPSFIIRESAVEDYIGTDELHFPIGSADLIASEIFKCIDSDHRIELWKRQLEWFRSETSFHDVSAVDV